MGFPRVSKKWLLLASLLCALAVCALFWLVDLHELKILAHTGMDMMRSAGPWVFFTAMALAPVLGFPMLAFTISVGPVFGDQLGIGGVLAASAAAILVNISLTYWLGRHALRPWIEKFVTKLGYKIPEVEPADQLEVTILLRVTPGPPFFLQSYLLGLAEIPFGKYWWPSFLLPMTHATSVIIFGDALLHGKGRLAVLGISLFIAAVLIVHLVRRHYAKRPA